MKELSEERKAIGREQTRKRVAKHRANMTDEKRKICKKSNAARKFAKTITEEEYLQIALRKRDRISKWSCSRNANEKCKARERVRKWRMMMRNLKKTNYSLWNYSRDFNETHLRRLSIFEDRRLPKMYDPVHGEMMARFRPDDTLKYTWVGEKSGVSIESRKPLDTWIPFESPFSLLTYVKKPRLVVGGLWVRK